MEVALSLIIPVAVVLLWTILVWVFPSILSMAIEKRIEHQFNKKLESTKAELQASYSSVGTSVGFLSAVQPELRSKIIESVERIWHAVHSLEEYHGGIMSLDSILLPEEVQRGLNSSGNEYFSTLVGKFKNFSTITEMASKCRALTSGIERLYVGDRLWLIFRTITLVYGRFAYLVHKSCVDKQYVDWREDENFNSILRNILSEDFITSAKARKLGGLRSIISQLESDFLKEGARVMSGSQGFSEALSDVQAVVKLETSKIVQEKELQAK